jgi:nucleoside-diphosphate-sugar epimerase
MARAIEWAVQRVPEAGGQFLAVNAGSNDWNYQVKDLAEAVAAEISGTRVSINTDAQPDKRSYRVDFSRFAHLAPDHQPQVSLAESVRRLVAGLRAIDFSDPEFRQSPLARLHVLRGLSRASALSADLRWSA